MAGGVPMGDVEIARLRDLHAAGLSRNAIARELGRSMVTVSRWAEKLGLSFDRSRTAAATAAKVVDAKARRAALAVALLEDAERLRQQLFAEATVFAFGGKDNTFAQRTLSRPTPGDQRAIVQAVNTAIQSSLRLEQHDSDTQGLAAVDQWIKDMVGG